MDYFEPDLIYPACSYTRTQMFLYNMANRRSIQVSPQVTAQIIESTESMSRVSGICRNSCTVLMTYFALF